MLNPADLAGYRRHQVYITQSKHVPLNVDAIRDVMPVFFELLAQEENALVRAILGHYYICLHSSVHGWKWKGRAIFNDTMLISGNYQWIVIPFEKGQEYMNALEEASVLQDILPLRNFLLMLLVASTNGTPIA